MISRWLVKAAALGLILALAPKPVSAQNRDDSTASPGLLAAINVEATKLAAADKEQSRRPQAALRSLPNQTRSNGTGGRARYAVSLGLLGWFAGWQLAAAVDRHGDSPGPELISMSIGAAAGAALGVWLAGR
jgi:hypothetical protein